MENAYKRSSRVLFVNPLLASHRRLAQYSVQMTRIGALISELYEPALLTGSSILPVNTARTIDGVSVYITKSIQIPILKRLFYALGEWFQGLDFILKSYHPDCLVCAEDLSLSTLQCIRHGRRLEIPVIVYSGLYINTGFPMGLPHFVYSKTVGRSVYSDADALVAKTTRAAQYLHAVGYPSKRIYIVPPTIDMERFQKCKPPKWFSSLKKEDQKVMLFVGGLTAHKNPTLLMDALVRVRESENAVLYAVVKDGAKARAFMNMIRKNNLQPFVKILKNVPAIDMPGLYSAADVLVSTSLVEIFGMNLLECLACGTPVVSTPTAGPTDMIIDGLNGYLARDFSSESIADALLSVLRRSSEYSLSAQAIRSSIIGKFDEQTVAKKWIRILTRVIGS
ncbi:MAG: glycosyltransferase family 4 protein [Candidatus Thorarchaeota archaeon]